MKINEKIMKIRELMKKDNIQAFIIPSGDPHMSEYFSQHWKTREFLSGFTGSVGTLVITDSMSGLWVDGRYYVQAEKELLGSEIILFRASEPDCPSFIKYLEKELLENYTVAFNGELFSLALVKDMQKQFSKKNIRILSNKDYGNDIWKDRPEEIYTDVFYLNESHSGKSPQEKLIELRKNLEKKKVNSLLIGKADAVSWLFNIRSQDIPCNPVVISYAFISEEKAILFTSKKRVDKNIETILNNNNIILEEYKDVFSYMKNLDEKSIILCDENEINYSLYEAVKNNSNLTPQIEINPILMMKACKNKIEIENTHLAYIKDGCAQAEFYGWLFETLKNNIAINEYECAVKIKEFRSLQEGYLEESFGAIMAYGPNAAMMHYSPSANKFSALKTSNFLLNDSGGQYLNGTTDTTRTFALGDITEQERHDFTITLKGIIALSTLIFKDGCTGSDLDIICRTHLWREGVDYRCGTGHGVGQVLNVHEGPPNFRDRTVQLKEGMCITIEPGIYTENSHGIRNENTVTVVPHIKTEYGQFYKFKTFTLVPIDISSLELSILTVEEKKWINNYHKQVLKQIYPLVSERAQKWLASKTIKI